MGSLQIEKPLLGVEGIGLTQMISAATRKEKST
jgi:hypothetical protein